MAKAHWIWTSSSPTAIGEWECYTRKTFELTSKVASAAVLVTADNVYELYVNGEYFGEDGGFYAIYWQSVERYDITKLLTPGINVLAARAKSLGGSADLVIAVRIETENQQPVEFYTDKSWPGRKTFDDNWNKFDYDINLDCSPKTGPVFGEQSSAGYFHYTPTHFQDKNLYSFVNLQRHSTMNQKSTQLFLG